MLPPLSLPVGRAGDVVSPRGIPSAELSGNALSIAFFAALRANGLRYPEVEYRFAKPLGRLWRFDYAWPDHDVALEVEGGVWTRGRHTRGQGFIDDIEKYNAATVNGWRVVRCVPSDLCSLSTIAMLKQLLNPHPDD